MRGLVRRLAMVAVPALLVGCASAPEGAATVSRPPAASGSAPVSGFYSVAQASRGRALFRRTCVECHSASEFRDSTFRRTWRGKTVADLYRDIAWSMPDDNPGGLPPQTYVDVIAYILQMNDFPSGDTRMTPDVEAMKGFPLWPSSGEGN